MDWPENTNQAELDHLLRRQGQELSATLRLHTDHHLHALARALESRGAALVRRKEEEAAAAGRTMAELELELRRSEEASRAWRKRAGEAEAVARVLSQAMDQTLDGSAGDNSRCGGSRGRCRVCGCEVCKVVFVPCMHLAACSLCADILASCPVCESAKQDTLEVLLPTEQ